MQTLSYRGQAIICLLTHCIWSSPTFIAEKQTKKERNAAWPYFWFSAHHFMLKNLALNMQLRYDEVCRVSNWNMSQKCTFFRTAHHASLKHVSGRHMFQNGTQHAQLFSVTQCPFAHSNLEGWSLRPTCISRFLRRDFWTYYGNHGNESILRNFSPKLGFSLFYIVKRLFGKYPKKKKKKKSTEIQITYSLYDIWSKLDEP